MSPREPAAPDVALAVWSHLSRALAPFGIGVEAMVLGILREMRVQGIGVFDADGNLRAEMLDGLIAAARELQRYVG